MTDRDYMQRAIDLARRGMGWTSPNPMVGAVIVKDGRIIGKGWHRKCGELHAERNAIAALTESAEGATIYVTLEPCCHHGRTPPCTDAIIENRIARVVIGSRDPNPKVSGKGAAILREHGIEVTEDFLKEECDELNPEFFHYITTGKPYVVVKYAMTLDGKSMVILSNCYHVYLETHRSYFDLDRWFRGYYCSEDYGFAPKEEIFREIQREHPDDKYIVIGDRKSDFMAGICNHMPVIGCAYGFGTEEELEICDAIAKDPSELPGIIGSRNLSI